MNWKMNATGHVYASGHAYDDRTRHLVVSAWERAKHTTTTQGLVPNVSAVARSRVRCEQVFPEEDRRLAQEWASRALGAKWKQGDRLFASTFLARADEPTSSIIIT